MANLGSPLSMQEVVNTVETILTIREGQIRVYSKDEETGNWIPQTAVPLMSAPATQFEVSTVSVPIGSVTQLPSKTCKRCVVIAHRDNNGLVWVGGSSVSNTAGIPLEPGQSQELAIANTDLVHAVADEHGDKIVVATLG